MNFVHNSIVYLILLIIKNQYIDCTNITFSPEPIRITLADLPPPYATPSVMNYAASIAVPPNPNLYVPKGFVAKLYMSDLQSPRYLQYTPNGDILVSESRTNRISCLLDTDKDGFPDQRVTIANETNGLTYPFGMAFLNGYLYSANQYNLRRYKWTDCSKQLSDTGEILWNYTGVRHITRTIVIPPTNDRIYISLGSASNVDPDELPLASIQVVDSDGKNPKMFAHGLRNAVGLAFHPVTGELYATCQERDEIGDDLVPDYFTRVQKNDFFGWPYAYLSSNFIDPRRNYSNGTSERPDLVAQTKTPNVLITSHSSALGITFYTGKQYPKRYQTGAFVALRGSGNRKETTGAKIIFIPFDESTGTPMNYYEDFVYGFLVNASHPQTFGSPVGLMELNDGSIIFTDESNHRIYQIQYVGENNSAFILISNFYLLIISYSILIYFYS